MCGSVCILFAAWLGYVIALMVNLVQLAPRTRYQVTRFEVGDVCLQSRIPIEVEVLIDWKPWATFEISGASMQVRGRAGSSSDAVVVATAEQAGTLPLRGSSRQRLSKRLELSWGSATDVATQLSGTALRNSSTEFTVTIGGRVTTWALTGFPITYEASMDMRVLCANYSCTDADNGGGEVDADGGRGVDESGGDDADGVDEQGDDNDLDFAERFELSTVTPLTISNPGAAQLGIAGEFGLLTNGLGLLSVVRMQFPVLDAEMLWSIPDTDAADAAGVPRDVAAGPYDSLR